MLVNGRYSWCSRLSIFLFYALIDLIVFRSKGKQTYRTYVRVSIELQNLYSEPLNIPHQSISGQLVVSLQSSFWVRLAFVIEHSKNFHFFTMFAYLVTLNL